MAALSYVLINLEDDPLSVFLVSSVFFVVSLADLLLYLVCLYFSYLNVFVLLRANSETPWFLQMLKKELKDEMMTGSSTVS